MSNKRFQECSKLEQIWRYRWYLLLTFKWIHIKINTLKYKDNHDDILKLTNKNIWKLSKGIMQGKMKWHYTSDEVFKRLKTYKAEIKQNKKNIL